MLTFLLLCRNVEYVAYSLIEGAPLIADSIASPLQKIEILLQICMCNFIFVTLYYWEKKKDGGKSTNFS